MIIYITLLSYLKYQDFTIFPLRISVWMRSFFVLVLDAEMYGLYALCRICWNKEFFLVFIFLHSGWVWRFTSPYLVQIQEKKNRKELCLRKLLTQWYPVYEPYVQSGHEKIQNRKLPYRIISVQGKVTEILQRDRCDHCTPLRLFSVIVTKSAVSCGFGHIYWINP